MKQNNDHKSRSSLTFNDFEKLEKPITFSRRDLIERIGVIAQKLHHHGGPHWSPAVPFGTFGSLERESPESPVFSSFTAQEDIFTAALNVMLAKPRRNHLQLSSEEKEAFNKAVRDVIQDGKYQHFVHSHGNIKDKHGRSAGGSDVGAKRFLSWHRAMMYQFEQLLQEYQPDIRIPYWDWVNDHNLPTWVHTPEHVLRGPNPASALPSQSQLDQLVLSKKNYSEFTMALEESPFHNQAHMWAGGACNPNSSTCVSLQNPMNSPGDPLFFLLHANVDRIWAIWQETHRNEIPKLKWAEAQMTPWSLTLDDLLDTYQLQYFYA